MMKARAKEMEYREVAKKAEPIQKKKWIYLIKN